MIAKPNPAQLDPNSTQAQAYFAALHANFFYFLQEVYREMGWLNYEPLDDIVEDMCNWHQHGPTRKITLAPRSDGKTYRHVAVGTAWDHYRDPKWIVGIVSKSRGSARETLGLIKQLYRKVWFLEHLHPDNDPTARNNAEEMDVAGRADGQRNASIWTAGIDSQLPSKRAHRVFGDDIEDPTNVVTLESRQALLARSREFDNIASYGQRRVDYVGTYHHEESVYIGLNNEGYAARTWPLIAPHHDDKTMGLSPLVTKKIRDGNLKPSTAPGVFDGAPIRPDKYSDQYIAEKKSRGLSNFAMQFMLISSLGDGLRYPLRLKDLIVFDTTDNRAPVSIAWGMNNGQGTSTAKTEIRSNGFGTDALYGPIFFDSNWMPFTGVKMWVDPSGQGADQTGYAITAYLGGMIYALEVGGLSDSSGSGHSPEVLHKLAVTAKKHRVNDIRIENFGLQSTFGQLLQPIVREHFTTQGQDPNNPDGWRCNVEMTTPPATQTNKEQRIIDILEPTLAQHRLVASTQVASSTKLQRQLTRITRQRGCLEHEDELEALAYATWLWQDQLDRAPQQLAQRAYEERQQRMLDKYLPKPTHKPCYITRR